MRKEFVKQIDSSREAPAELVSLSHGSALIGANQSCTLCGATPAVTKARYKNPLGNIDYTHIFCDNCANKYGVGQSGTIYRAEPMEQAFLLLKDIAREIAEYQEGMLHGTSPYHSLRLSPVRHGPPTKGRKLDTLENRRFLSGHNLGNHGYELPTNEIIERIYGGKGKVRNSPLPLLDPVTGESLSGRFVFNAEALAFSPNLTERGHIDDNGNIIDMNALTRANPDVPPEIHNANLNLYGFEGIDPHRFGENVQAEGIIYGDVDENKVHQLNDNPLSIKEISRASRLMSPFVNAKKEFDSFKEHDYKRIRRAAEALMRAQIPPVMFDTQGLDNQNIWSPDDPRLAEPINAKFLHDPFKQWDRGAGKNTEEMLQQVAYGAMSPEQFELLDHDLVFASEPMEIAMRLLKAYLPTLQERGRKIDDQVSLRWIPKEHESTFHAAVPFHNSRSNVNWEQRIQNEKLKAPKDSAHSQRKTLPGVFEGDSKTPSNNPITGSWVAPATQQGAMGADVTFSPKDDKGLLMAINESPDWWRTLLQGASPYSPAGEGFKYGGFDKEAFSKIPTPNISPMSMLHYQMALENPMLEEDEVAQRFPDEHELITQFPNIKTEDIWGPLADLTINPVKVASEPMDIAMRLLKRQTTLSAFDERQIQENLKPKNSNIFIAAKPGNEETKPEELSQLSDNMLAELAALKEKHGEFGITSATGNAAWNLEPSFMLTNVPQSARGEINAIAEKYRQDSIAVSEKNETGAKFVTPQGQITDEYSNMEMDPNAEYSTDFPTGQRLTFKSEPMEIAMRLLKERVSPEAKRHKLEYDKKYESSPERVKYREDLNRERRRRHIMGQGGPDMSHTSQHTIVPEDPHTNRARHFKDKGTLL